MHERIYTIRGKLNGASTQHEEVQLNFEKHKGQNYLYRVREFRVYSTDSLATSSVTGVLTKSLDNAIAPEELDLENQNILAWAQQVKMMRPFPPVAPGLPEVPELYSDSFLDMDSRFGYGLFVHTNSSNTAVDVNYYIVVEKYKATDIGFIAESVSQNQLNNP